jgi:hypothetical protein
MTAMLPLFHNPIYHSTFSGLAVIKLLFKNAKISRNYLFEMTKFKEIPREGKIQKLVEKSSSLLHLCRHGCGDTSLQTLNLVNCQLHWSPSLAKEVQP